MCEASLVTEDGPRVNNLDHLQVFLCVGAVNNTVAVLILVEMGFRLPQICLDSVMSASLLLSLLCFDCFCSEAVGVVGRSFSSLLSCSFMSLSGMSSRLT